MMKFLSKRFVRIPFSSALILFVLMSCLISAESSAVELAVSTKIGFFRVYAKNHADPKYAGTVLVAVLDPFIPPCVYVSAPASDGPMIATLLTAKALGSPVTIFYDTAIFPTGETFVCKLNQVHLQ